MVSTRFAPAVVMQVRDELRRDGVVRLGLAVLPRVAEVRDDGGDPRGGSALHGVDHDEQFHQVVVDGRAGRLNDETVGTADGVVDGNRNLPVAERADFAFAHRKPEALRNLLGRFPACAGGENFDVFSVKTHFLLIPL